MNVARTRSNGASGADAGGELLARVARGFTLLELLVVIAIIGILAAIAMPTLNAFKPDATAAATQQLMADLARARQLAMSQRTTVYMVFVPTNFYNSPHYASLSPEEKQKADRLLDKQYVGYNFVSLRSAGDQPGRGITRYHGAWKTLPQGTFIALDKFTPRSFYVPPITNYSTGEFFPVLGFQRTNNIPFPSEKTEPLPGFNPYIEVPYIAFNYMGQLESSQEEVIPLARGSVMFGRDATREPTPRAPSFIENPPGNSRGSSFTLVYIDRLTGRTHVQRQEIQ